MTKQEQIEEMADILCQSKNHKCDGEDCKCIKQATDLYNAKCRIISEDSVVLSREEYEELKSLYDSQRGAYMTSSIGDLPLTVKGLRKAVDEITRLIGVQTELQELNANYYNEAKDLRREVNRLKAHAMINDEHLHIRIKEQARKKTAKEILDYFDRYAGTGEKLIGNMISEQRKKYGVEVEE